MTQWAWGIDVSTRRVAIGATDGSDVRWASTDIAPNVRGAYRLSLIRAATETLIHGFARPWAEFRPTGIVVEDANIGAAANKPLIQAVGVVMEVCQSVCRCPVLELPIGTWKKEVLGFGNAKKPDIERWFFDTAPDGEANQDEMDALAISFAAHNRLDQR